MWCHALKQAPAQSRISRRGVDTVPEAVRGQCANQRPLLNLSRPQIVRDDHRSQYGPGKPLSAESGTKCFRRHTPRAHAIQNLGQTSKRVPVPTGTHVLRQMVEEVGPYLSTGREGPACLRRKSFGEPFFYSLIVACHPYQSGIGGPSLSAGPLF